MKTKHTPTPWFAKVDFKNEKVDILTVDKPIKDDEENLRECIACVFDKANAAFIVRAVNAHERLVAFMKDTIRERGSMSASEEALLVEVGAIAKAEGKS